MRAICRSGGTHRCFRIVFAFDFPRAQVCIESVRIGRSDYLRSRDSLVCPGKFNSFSNQTLLVVLQWQLNLMQAFCHSGTTRPHHSDPIENSQASVDKRGAPLGLVLGL